LMCESLKLKYEDYVEEISLPSKMTLTKVPSLDRQFELTGYIGKVHIQDGVKRVLSKVLGK